MSASEREDIWVWKGRAEVARNRAEAAEADLARAVALLKEFGACDPYTGQPYDEVTEFLERTVG